MNRDTLFRDTENSREAFINAAQILAREYDLLVSIIKEQDKKIQELISQKTALENTRHKFNRLSQPLLSLISLRDKLNKLTEEGLLDEV